METATRKIRASPNQPCRPGRRSTQASTLNREGKHYSLSSPEGGRAGERRRNRIRICRTDMNLTPMKRPKVTTSLRLVGAAFGCLLAAGLRAQVPAFTDANWMSLGTVPGADGTVRAAVADGTGDVYIGGDFT